MPKMLLVVEVLGRGILQGDRSLVSNRKTLFQLLGLTWVVVEKAEARD